MKQRIFRVATELFARNGYHATGVKEISDSVGLGRGALYYHIKSKEDLLFHISMSLLAEINPRARAVTESNASVEEQVFTLARDLLRSLAENREGWAVSLSETRSLSEERRDAVIAARDEYEAIWASVLERGVRTGVLRDSSPLTRRAILGMLNSTHLWLDEKGATPPEEIARLYMDLILRGLRKGEHQ
jgi:AcrR family transcriptional regulator